MITGETVLIELKEEGPADAIGDPTVTTSTITVDNVIVGPGSTNNLTDSIRPDGVIADYTLHLPKGYETYDLSGLRVQVRGKWFDVIGNPGYYTPDNAPGNWDYPVEVKRCDG